MPWDIFSSMLNWWQWGLLLAVPPAVIALYFLKLRRQPLEVPSTFLWRRTIEDLHVNSLWQRLRQNLLLLLQLLLLALLILACLRPSWRGRSLTGDRFIFLIDTSASMSATDVEPTRLFEAKKQAENLIGQMKSGDAGMIVSFSDRPRVEQPFTIDLKKLRDRVRAIKPTNRGSHLTEALQVAAGLANPGRTGERSDGAADAMPADVYIFTDGGLKDVPEFAWGNLRPIYARLGVDAAENVAITALGVNRNIAQPERMQAFVRIENFSPHDVSALRLSLYLDGTFLDASEVSIPAGGIGGTEFTFDSVDQANLRVDIDAEDALEIDNVAHAGINRPVRAEVLVITPTNDALAAALSTTDITEKANVDFQTPAYLTEQTYLQAAENSQYDLIIYDQCTPERMPRCNTLLIGRLPSSDGWRADEEREWPKIIDSDNTHPLMMHLNFGNVQLIASGRSINGPAGQKVLIEGDIGPLCVIAPREGYEDTVLGFEIVGADENGEAEPKTDWPRRLSFPLFFRNLVAYSSGIGEENSLTSAQPGQVVRLQSAMSAREITVVSPSGKKSKLEQSPANDFVYTQTNEIGVYNVIEGPQNDNTQRFSVNLFDPVESNIKPREVIETQWDKVAAESGFETSRREAYRWILMLAFAVLLFEWYVYNRRVYI